MSWVAGGVVGHGGEELLTLPRLGMDGGREARVLRYREKRPRMKGRFIKLATAGGGVAIAPASRRWS
jgi:hypothetical protein